MNILGINIGHHSSVCLLQNGEIIYFIQEERLNRQKHSPLPFKSVIELIQNYPIDVITWASPGSPKNEECFPLLLNRLALTYNPNTKFINYSSNHHKIHAASTFYNSGFKEGVCIVIDGIGSSYKNENNNFLNYETESIYQCSYPDNLIELYKNILNTSRFVNLSRAYEAIAMHLGWGRYEVGKVMGLAPYGKSNSLIPNLIYKNIANPQIFYTNHHQKGKYPSEKFPQTFIDEKLNPNLKLNIDPREWHYNPSKISNLEKDIAWKIQKETQELVGDYIEQAIEKTGLKQVCCAGGYFLNCVANYYLIKRFPNIEFYFEPISYDAGTAIGAAQLAYREFTKDNNIYPQKTLYYGPQYSKEELLEGIKKYVDN